MQNLEFLFKQIRARAAELVASNRALIEKRGVEIEEVHNDDNFFVVYFFDERFSAQIIIEKQTFAPYRFVCFEMFIGQQETTKIVHYWYDDESSTLSEVEEELTKCIEFMLNY